MKMSSGPDAAAGGQALPLCHVPLMVLHRLGASKHKSTTHYYHASAQVPPVLTGGGGWVGWWSIVGWFVLLRQTTKATREHHHPDLQPFDLKTARGTQQDWSLAEVLECSCKQQSRSKRFTIDWCIFVENLGADNIAADFPRLFAQCLWSGQI